MLKRISARNMTAVVKTVVKTSALKTVVKTSAVEEETRKEYD